MSIVVVKVTKDTIDMAADSILVKGWSKMPGDKFSKMQKINDIIIGGVGKAEECSLLFHYLKTHILDTVDEMSIMDFFIEFKHWKNNITDSKEINNQYLLACKGKAFYIEKMLVIPINDYYAIGAGEDYAHGALYMGATAVEAVRACVELCAMVSLPIKCECIKIIN